MSYHNRLSKLNGKRLQIAKEEQALEKERQDIIRKYDTRRKIFCGAIFLKKIYEEKDPQIIRLFFEELQKAPERTREEFPEFFGKMNDVLGEKVQLSGVDLENA